MADRLEDLLRSCVVRIANGSTSGAGFFVAPGKVITCVHVVGTGSFPTVHWAPNGSQSAEFAVSDVLRLADRGRPIPALASDYPDIAVLTVPGIAGHPCVAIDEDWPGGSDVFQAFGYPAEGGATLLTPAKLTYRGLRGTWPALFLDLGWDVIKHGMSGAPVLNLRTGGVCGVVVASRDTQQLVGALAVPWSAVMADLDDVLSANAAFHRRDGRWAKLKQLANLTVTAVAPGGAGGGGVGHKVGVGAAGWIAGARHAQRRDANDTEHVDDHDDDEHPSHHDDDLDHDDEDDASSGSGSSAHDDDDDDHMSDVDDDPVDLGETDDDDPW